MPTKLEDAQRLKDEAEQAHERMVDFIRMAREAERQVHLHNSEIAALGTADPKRAELTEMRNHFQQSAVCWREAAAATRILIDSGAIIVDAIEDGV